MSGIDEEPIDLDVFDESDEEREEEQDEQEDEDESGNTSVSKKKTDAEEPEENIDSDAEGSSDDGEDDDDDEEQPEENDDDAIVTDENDMLQKNLFNIENVGYTDDLEDEDENYLQKFNENLSKDIVDVHYPEYKQHNYDEVDVLSKVVRNDDGIIIDPLHKTTPIMTRYERATIIGERAKQLEGGAIAFIPLEPNEIDSYYIAKKEFDLKKIPFIVKRPLPNGACEYWRINDLEVL